METVTKAKSSLTLSLKSKTRAVQTQLIILSLLSRDKKTLLAAITKRLRALLGHEPKLTLPSPPPPDDHQLYVDQNVSTSWTVANPAHTEVVKPEEAATVAEQVQDIDCRKERKEEEEVEAKVKGEEGEEEYDDEEVVEKKKEMIRLGEGIDKEAELFIERFYRQIRMQGQQSFQDEQLFSPPQPL